jgi:glycosyltransferase involved in cell wall biosynthesis
MSAVSVVIPTYNRARMVIRAIDSVLAQTFRDLELIVVDDGSTDDTVSRLRMLADARIRVLSLPANSGGSRARNEGLRAARADLVAFLDSDDEWLPLKLEAQLARLRESEDPRVAVVYCPWLSRDHLAGREAPGGLPATEGDVLDALLGGWNVATSAALIRRGALERVGGFDESLAGAHDYDLWLRLAAAGHHFVAVREPLVIKHAHGEPRISMDLRARSERTLDQLDRRWGALVRDRLGLREYLGWRARCRSYIFSTHFMRVRVAMAHGQRLVAWGHCRELWRGLPGSRQHFVRGMLLTALGWRGYRILSALARRVRRRRPAP